MYFGDVGELESHLNNDCTVLLRNLKAREDQHYELLQYNRRIIQKQRQEDDELFINDEVLQHQAHLAALTASQKGMRAEQKEITEKYEGNVVDYESIFKLMGRVGARVLETCQYSLDKCKALDETLTDKHAKMKAQLVRLLGQRESLNLEAIIVHVLGYARDKLGAEVEQLRKLIKALEDGEYSRLNEIYSPVEKRKALSMQKRKISIEKVKVLSVGKEMKSPIREQIRKQDKIKKKKQKLATRLVTCAYSTMDLARAQFMEDITCNEREKAQRLYHEIFSRNRFNHQQIIAFEAQKEAFEEKVRLFKEMMERESQKITQVLIRKPINRANRPVEPMEECEMAMSQEEEPEGEKVLDLTPASKRMNGTRYRIHSPKNRREKNEVSGYTSVLKTPKDFDHFRFDKTNQEVYARSNRNRLPQIQNNSAVQHMRASSLDHRLEPRHKIRAEGGREGDVENMEELIRNERPRGLSKEEKYMIQRTKVAMKNIEVGVEGVMGREEQQFQQHQKRRPPEPSPMEYTFYVRRSRNKFYEPKHNIII